jgi:hypothetical protein
MNTFYDTINIVSDTWLVAGYASPRVDPEFALYLIDTSAQPIRETHLELDVPQSYRCGGHFSGLHSGESVAYDRFPVESGPQHLFLPSSSEVLFTALIKNYDTKTDGIAAYCITLRLSELLKFAKQGGDIPWKGWEGYTSTSEVVSTNLAFSDFSVSGRRLLGPLEEVEPGKLTTVIHEFDPSDGYPFVVTGSTSLMDTEVEVRKSEQGGEGEEVMIKPPLRPVKVRLNSRREDLVEVWTNAAIVEDELLTVAVCESPRYIKCAGVEADFY